MPKAKSSSSLFESLVGEPRLLLEAYINDPKSYEHELLPVLTKLVSGIRYEELTPEEKELLNRATVTYAERTSASKKLNEQSTRTQSSSMDDPSDEDGEDDEEAYGIPGELITREGQSPELMPPFEVPVAAERWWMKR